MSILSKRRAAKAHARRARYERIRNMMRNNMRVMPFLKQVGKEWIAKPGAINIPVGDADSMSKSFPFCLPKSRKWHEPANA